MKKCLLAFVCVLSILLFPMVLPADEDTCQVIVEGDTCQCEGECQEGCPCYFPRNSIFQDSTIREDYDDPPTWGWPGRRGGELSDELSR